MKFIIPQREDLTREVIKEVFFKTYYPEMKVRQGWWYIHGRYVMLQKNPFVCAKFDVKQKDKGAKTQIRMNKDSNFWTYIIGAPIIGNFIHGDFFEDVEGNFKKFLMKKYGFNESEIEIVPSFYKKRKFWILLGINLCAIMLVLGIILGLLYWHSNNRFTYAVPYETEESSEKALGYDIVTTENKVKGGIIYRNQLIYGSDKKVILDKRGIFIETPVINDHVLVSYSDRDQYSFDYYNLFKSGERVFEEKEFVYLSFLDDKTLIYRKANGESGYCDLKGDNVFNMKTIMCSLGDQGICLVGFVLGIIILIIVNILARKKLKMNSQSLQRVSVNEDNTSVSPDETIRYERTEDSDTTLKL